MAKHPCRQRVPGYQPGWRPQAYAIKQEVKPELIRSESQPLHLHLNGTVTHFSAYASATSRAKPMRCVGRNAAVSVDLYKDCVTVIRCVVCVLYVIYTMLLSVCFPTNSIQRFCFLLSHFVMILDRHYDSRPTPVVRRLRPGSAMGQSQAPVRR